MSWSVKTLETITRLEGVQKSLSDRYVGREHTVRLLVLTAVCREHALLLGPPGTAKTDLVTRFARLLNAKPFNYLLSRFTEPAEIFGPMDYIRFQQGDYRVRTEGMLPEAEFAFLDELFQGSSAILNTLLALLNERVFHNGAQQMRVPLVSLFGAATEPPEDPALRAFADRFLLRAQVEPTSRGNLSDLLELGWEHESERLRQFEERWNGSDEAPVAPILDDPDLLRSLHRSLRDVRLENVRPMYADLIRDLLGEGVTLSDRRIVRGQKLVAAAALLHRRQEAELRDLWPLAHMWTEPGDREIVAGLVAERIAQEGAAGLEPARRPAEILAAAQQRTRSLNGTASYNQAVAVLRDLHALGQELRRDHPDDKAAHQRFLEIRRPVEQLLEQQA